MAQSSHTTSKLSPEAALARDLVDRIEELLREAQQAGQPIEVEPYRQRLFELFVMADAGGFLAEGAAHDLSSDGVARELASRWDLARTVGGGLSQPASLPPEQLARVRLLWSFMRMWMEWTYAWQRWSEFHQSSDARGA